MVAEEFKDLEDLFSDDMSCMFNHGDCGGGC